MIDTIMGFILIALACILMVYVGFFILDSLDSWGYKTPKWFMRLKKEDDE